MKNNFYAKKILTTVVLLGFLILSSFVSVVGTQDAGKFIWSKTKIAPLATLFSPRDTMLLFAIGNYYFGGGGYDLDKAKEYYKRVILIDENFPGPHYQLSRIYFLQEKFFTAILEINKEIELHPENKRSYYIRGLIYGYQKMFDKAEKDFKKFLEWKPDSWAGWNDLSWIYFQKGDYKASRDSAREGLKFSTTNPWLLNTLGVSLMNLGDKAGAEKYLKEALSVLKIATPEDWGQAYPGNNPKIYGYGLLKMKESIRNNLKLLGVSVEM